MINCGQTLGSLWARVGIAFGSNLGGVEITLGPRFGWRWGCFEGRFGATLGGVVVAVRSLWCPSASTLSCVRSSWYHVRVISPRNKYQVRKYIGSWSAGGRPHSQRRPPTNAIRVKVLHSATRLRGWRLEQKAASWCSQGRTQPEGASYTPRLACACHDAHIWV